MRTEISIEDMAVFCKRKGFVYPNSELYNGLAGFFDFGPYGAELKNNIKQAWWKYFVHDREDIVGIDGSIICHPKVWVASGHVAVFNDPIVECTKCAEKYRADHLIEENTDVKVEGLKAAELNKILQDSGLSCPKCKGKLGEVGDFNMMFTTAVGPKGAGDNRAFLRPETAQLMFTNFRAVIENARMKLPFGIAQMGKSFRNEISPRNFLFRCREFEQMEIEYFVHPDLRTECPYTDFGTWKMKVYSADMQAKGQPEKLMSVKDALKKKIIKNPWHAYWLAASHSWFVNHGTRSEKLRVRQHLEHEKSHYASDTWDLEYQFPFGWKELEGIADRGDYDLQQHMKYSGKDLGIFDEATKKKVVPHVIAEPSLGVERSFLVFLFDAYEDSKERGNIVLHLHPSIAPIKVGIFPLVGKLEEEAHKVFKDLQKSFTCVFDRSGSIGRRYARADELGIPFCVTVDFESGTVTVRDRETTAQVRVPIPKLKESLQGLIDGTRDFKDIGPKVEPSDTFK